LAAAAAVRPSPLSRVRVTRLWIPDEMIDVAQLLICLQPLGPVPWPTRGACSDVSCRQAGGGNGTVDTALGS
jgi:hypothetical protein